MLLRIIAATIVGIVTAVAIAQPPAPKPAAKVQDIPVEGWIPQKAGDRPPSAFPNIKGPEWKLDANQKVDIADIDRQFARLCPRILGDSIRIEVGDHTYRRLLKARIHQGHLEVLKTLELVKVGRWDSMVFQMYLECLDDMRESAAELCGSDTREFAAWLEEFLVLAKEAERFTIARVEVGQDPPQATYRAQRHRLKIEAMLLKANRSNKP